MEINIRDIERKNIDALAEIICNTWGFNDSFSASLAYKIGRLYLAESLYKSNFTKVAFADGKAVGLILARAENLKNFDVQKSLYLLKCMLSVIFNFEALRALKVFADIERQNTELYKEAAGDFDGEITLFAVDEALRGFGIGKRLYTAALDFLKDQGAKNYFVFTDTTCNYGFYEHEGAIRLKEKEMLIPL